MMKFLLGLIIGLGVVPAVGFVYFRLGFTPVATAAPAMPFEKKLAAGARIYREYCAFCHGIAGQAETASPKGMFPHPPVAGQPAAAARPRTPGAGQGAGGAANSLKDFSTSGMRDSSVG